MDLSNTRLGRWLGALRRNVVDAFASMRAGRGGSPFPSASSAAAAPPPICDRVAEIAPRADAVPSAMRASASRDVRDAFGLQLQLVQDARQGVGHRLQALGMLAKGLRANQAIGDADRQACLKDLAQAHQVCLQELADQAGSITAKLSLAELRTALPERRQLLADLVRGLEQGPPLDDEVRRALTARLAEARWRLDRLETREADLAAIRTQVQAARSSSVVMGPGAPAQAQGPIKPMADVLATLPPDDYLAARRSLDQLLERLPDTPPELLMERLNDYVGHPDQVRWLHDMAKGEADIIDMVLRGAAWNEDARALKRVAYDPKDPNAELRLAVQHDLRVVREDLNAAMVASNLAGGENRLPVNLFSAVKADPKVLNWLAQNAASEVAARNAQIGAWISLSLFDPETCTVPEQQVDALLAQVTAHGIQPQALREHIRQGFKNTAEVAACRELVRQVAQSLKASALITTLEEKQSALLKASRVARDLIREVTGLETDVATGPQLDAAVASTVTQSMPWLAHEPALKGVQEAIRERRRTLSPDGSSERRWLNDPGQLEAASKDHELIHQFLQAELAYKALPDIPANRVARQKLAQVIAATPEKLKGFSALHLRRVEGASRVPELSDLRSVALEIEFLRGRPQAKAEGADGVGQVSPNEQMSLAKLYDEEARLKVLAAPAEGQVAGAQQLLTRLRQLAILQAALLRGEPFFRLDGDSDAARAARESVLARLAAFGVARGLGSPYKDAAVDAARTALEAERRDLAALASAFDPGALTLANMFGAVRQRAKSLRGSAGLAVKGPSASRSVKQAPDAQVLESVDRQVRALKAGESFDIRVGVHGELSVGTPIVPGVSTSTQLRAEQQQGLRVTREASGAYVVRVQTGAAAGHGMSLSTASDLVSFRGQSNAARERGFDLTFKNQPACLAMLRGLVTGDDVDPALWQEARAQSVASKSAEIGASLSVGAELSLASLSAEAAASAGVGYTRTQSAAGETETLRRRVEVTATASASAVTGGASRVVTTGVQLEASKTLERRQGMLAAGSGVTLSAAAVGGNVDRCIDSLFPSSSALSPQQRAAIVAALPREEDKVPEGTELFVRFRLTPIAIRHANALLGEAAEALTLTSLSKGDLREAVLARARALSRKADEITRRTESYTLEGWGWTRREQAEVTQHRGAYQQFARGEQGSSQFFGLATLAGEPAASAEGGAGPLALPARGMSPVLAALLP